MRFTIMILATLMAAALFALGIFLFTQPTEIRELMEPIDASSYQPDFTTSTENTNQELDAKTIEEGFAEGDVVADPGSPQDEEMSNQQNPSRDETLNLMPSLQ